MRTIALILAVLATLAGMYFGALGILGGAENIGGAAVLQVQLLRSIACFAFAIVFLLSGLNDNGDELGALDKLAEQNTHIMNIMRDIRDGKKG